MITLPEPLNKVMRSGHLEGIKPFAVLIRNKWYAEESASGFEESDSGSDLGGHFALDMANPIDISSMIVKPNTLSMTLDVNEVAQYKANNVTLTLSDPFNKFIEGTPQSYFPAGYQLYGSQVVLYYGLDTTNRTPLFIGVIKDLPTHKPEQYQVDLKLISPLELLSDIEAKDFSNKYVGEILIANGYDDDNNPIYKTANTGVGGFNAVYADGVKIFEGVDYEVSQTNTLGFPALVTIINEEYHNSDITADYYCWKTGLTVEQIVRGLVALAGYIDNTDIRNVVWQTDIKNITNLDVIFAIGFYKENNDYIYNWFNTSSWSNFNLTNGRVERKSIFPNEFTINFSMGIVVTWSGTIFNRYLIGDEITGNYVKNGYQISQTTDNGYTIRVSKFENGTATTETVYTGYYKEIGGVRFSNNQVFFFDIYGNTLYTGTKFFTPEVEIFEAGNANRLEIRNMIFSLDVQNNIIAEQSDRYNCPIIQFHKEKLDNSSFWGEILSSFSVDDFINYNLQYRYSNDNINFSSWENIDINADLGIQDNYLQVLLEFTQDNIGTNILNPAITYYSSSLILQLINLSGKTVLEALQDFALISGYEFGVDRQGVFFFRPRSQSTTPIYDLDNNEIVKIDNVQKKFNDFFTKLTLTFAQVPLEFYANEGERPTPIDKYGVINKEIDKPDIVNYDNPELAQAIGPQLLAIYSNLADIIQLTGKLNLSLELGDIVNVKRNYNLTVPESASDYTKFINQNTYYQAAKITGLNYNFDKRQITYTLRHVSNENNEPQQIEAQFVYDFPIELGNLQ